jgi:hypothetical protein
VIRSYYSPPGRGAPSGPPVVGSSSSSSDRRSGQSGPPAEAGPGSGRTDRRRRARARARSAPSFGCVERSFGSPSGASRSTLLSRQSASTTGSADRTRRHTLSGMAAQRLSCRQRRAGPNPAFTTFEDEVLGTGIETSDTPRTVAADRACARSANHHQFVRTSANDAVIDPLDPRVKASAGFGEVACTAMRFE